MQLWHVWLSDGQQLHSVIIIFNRMEECCGFHCQGRKNRSWVLRNSNWEDEVFEPWTWWVMNYKSHIVATCRDYNHDLNQVRLWDTWPFWGLAQQSQIYCLLQWRLQCRRCPASKLCCTGAQPLIDSSSVDFKLNPWTNESTESTSMSILAH